MIYYIKGHVKNKAVVEQYVVNLIKHYRIHTRKSGSITIKFTKNLGGNYLGTCLGDRRDIEILINKNQSFLSQMRTLSHEFIHAKQFLRGELDPTGRVWKGKNCSHMKYGTEPYEVEAFEGEDALFMKTFPFDLI
jgi:hypothetical protein